MQRRLKQIDGIPSEIDEQLSVVVQHARKISETVEDFRWLADPGEAEPEEPAPLRPLVEAAVRAVDERLGSAESNERRVGLSALVALHLRDEPELAVRCRPTLLQRAIENLVQNAWEAVMTQKLPDAGDVAVYAYRDGERVAVVEVVDRGPGFQDPDLLFAPHFTTKAANKGLGLGLSITEQIVRRHRGQILPYCSIEQPGARFRLEFPLASRSEPGERSLEETRT